MSLNTNVKVVFLGGKKASGKDTFAEMLKKSLEEKGVDVSIHGMSDPLLEALLRIDPLINNDSYGLIRVSDFSKRINYDYVKMKEDKEVRRLLQVIGTDVVRDMINEDAWVDIAKNKIKKNIESNKLSILTGIRFPNELNMKKCFPNSLDIYIERSFNANNEESIEKHSSELSLSRDDFSLIIENNEDLNSLKKKADYLAQLIPSKE